MTDELEFAETDDLNEVMEEADLVLGFAWHDEERHWHLESYSFPESFTEEQVTRLEAIGDEFAERLKQEGFILPKE